MLQLRRLTAAEVPLVAGWLRQPHVARWYLSASTIEAELADVADSLQPGSATEVLLVLVGDRPVGWCQWYRCDDYPEHAAGVGSEPGDVGIDYAIGDPAYVGRGAGTALIAAMLERIRQHDPDSGVVADPEATNRASRRVLEKNGFLLVAERVVESEPHAGPMAIYRRPSRGQ